MPTTTTLTPDQRLQRHGGHSPARVAAFAAVLLLVLGWPVYSYVNERVTGGVHQRAGYKEVDVATLASFKFNRAHGTIDDVPARFRALEGQRVRVRGFVHSIRESDGPYAKLFVLASRYQSQWGPGMLGPQERVTVTVPPDKRITVETDTYYWVLGTFHLDLRQSPEEGVFRLFELNLESAERCD